MKTLSINSRSKIFESIELEYLVYEKNDDGLLLVGKTRVNNKTYATSFSINFKELNALIGKVLSACGLDLNDLLLSKVFNSEAHITELDFTKEYGAPIMLSDYSFDYTYNQCA